MEMQARASGHALQPNTQSRSQLHSVLHTLRTMDGVSEPPRTSAMSSVKPRGKENGACCHHHHHHHHRHNNEHALTHTAASTRTLRIFPHTAASLRVVRTPQTPGPPPSAQQPTTARRGHARGEHVRHQSPTAQPRLHPSARGAPRARQPGFGNAVLLPRTGLPCRTAAPLPWRACAGPAPPPSHGSTGCCRTPRRTRRSHCQSAAKRSGTPKSFRRGTAFGTRTHVASGAAATWRQRVSDV